MKINILDIFVLIISLVVLNVKEILFGICIVLCGNCIGILFGKRKYELIVESGYLLEF